MSRAITILAGAIVLLAAVIGGVFLAERSERRAAAQAAELRETACRYRVQECRLAALTNATLTPLQAMAAYDACDRERHR